RRIILRPGIRRRRQHGGERERGADRAPPQTPMPSADTAEHDHAPPHKFPIWVPATGPPRRERRGVRLAGTSGEEFMGLSPAWRNRQSAFRSDDGKPNGAPGTALTLPHRPPRNPWRKSESF